MVFFSCDGCGDMMKKAKVDMHAAKCRQCYAVSCVDCSVSFPGDDYRSHTNCISEAERYEKTVFRGVKKADQNNQSSKKRKLTPQEAWNRTIHTAIESAPPNLRSYMEALAETDNVPRKEKQFRNFAGNSLGLRGMEGQRVMGEVWKLLSSTREEERTRMAKEEEERKNQKQKKVEEQKEAGESRVEETTGGKDSSAAPVSDEDEDTPESNNEKAAADKAPTASTVKICDKAVGKAMKKALKKAPDKALKFKELRKQVQAALAVDSRRKKELEKVLKLRIESGSDKMEMDGKVVRIVGKK